MLELIINSKKDGSFGTRYISEIRDGDKVLAKYNKQTLKTDIEVCRPYIGQEFKIINYLEEHKNHNDILHIDTTKRAILTGVEEEEGVKYLKYDIIEPDKELI